MNRFPLSASNFETLNDLIDHLVDDEDVENFNNASLMHPDPCEDSDGYSGDEEDERLLATTLQAKILRHYLVIFVSGVYSSESSPGSGGMRRTLLKFSTSSASTRRSITSFSVSELEAERKSIHYNAINLTYPFDTGGSLRRGPKKPVLIVPIQDEQWKSRIWYLKP